jgi:hypothetical protein
MELIAASVYCVELLTGLFVRMKDQFSTVDVLRDAVSSLLGDANSTDLMLQILVGMFICMFIYQFIIICDINIVFNNLSM